MKSLSKEDLLWLHTMKIWQEAKLLKNYLKLYLLQKFGLKKEEKGDGKGNQDMKDFATGLRRRHHIFMAA